MNNDKLKAKEISIQHKRTLNGRDYYSQACQDLFVIEMLEGKRGGFYIEIGGADPFTSNNTFLLENAYEWKGFSLEFDAALSERYNLFRRNKCFNADATTYDYLKKINDFQFPEQIDYLSVDIDPADNTYAALLKCPFETHRFSVITYEHDRYSIGPKYMELSRVFLTSKGYKLVIGNVLCFGRDFEDWWVDPNVIPDRLWKKYENQNINFSEIFNS